MQTSHEPWIPGQCGAASTLGAKAPSGGTVALSNVCASRVSTRRSSRSCRPSSKGSSSAENEKAALRCRRSSATIASTGCGFRGVDRAVTRRDVLLEDLKKLRNDRVALERHAQLTVDVHRSLGLLECP